ncbi:hypothetical protein SPRG_07190 [Saprolegnia parasitica CBS 223.65]|uniref:CKK domain-containing protein n=1 Tax=Saprolegnia parasitica (strain CBS 223.65) TaxID=695850 RepID=A0A067CM64_SAPPC|nr:hypothetical protein SPRG_07190 [Saprolegnia parasitica CBS 223.65]KDO27917.1 hypothetical protein SPRG_07190 [Saprolegnia parasitica CBS 223.65]|eukprot:XP_012201374.1 hypothetical protein SPRG_07190 [Saprolegnia parasitica CBS 223.65]
MAKKLVLSMAAQEHAGFAFAAQLLSLDAPSSSHLKKETLSPWVVHAHHCGLDFRVGMPPPPTLAIARPPSTLGSVVDLADTIACLHERRPACLHLAFDAKIMVLWLHSPDKFLLYVCPAKVKVLKSLQEVVAKMTDDVDSDEPCTLRLLVSTNNQTNASPSAEIPLPDTSPVPHQVPRLASPCPTRTLSPSKAASAYPLPNYKAKLGATTWALLELQAAALAANTTGVSDRPSLVQFRLAPRQETVVRQPTSVDLHFVGVEAPPTLDRSQRLAELRAEKIKAQRLRQLETRRLQIQARAPLDDPKVAASKPSNRQLIQNAIEYTLLAGVACEKERTKVLGVLSTHPSENFVVALKGSALDSRKMTYRGLYVLDPTSGVVSRVLGSGPNTLDASSVMQFFRYNSGKKAFVGVSTRSFTVATDAAAVPDDCFRPLKAKRPSYL